METIAEKRCRAGRRRRVGAALALLTAFVVFPAGAAAATGPLRPDRDFGTRGVVRVGSGYITPYSVAFDSRGRVLVGAQGEPGTAKGRPAVFRFRPDGRPDRGFGRSGVARLESSAADVGLVPDRSGGVYALVTLEEKMLLTHLGPDGTPERRFGTRGRVRTALSSEPSRGVEVNHPLVMLPGGGLIVAGRGGSNNERFEYRGPLELRRLSPDGHRVRAFGREGVVVLSDPRLRHFVMSDVASTADGGILVSGSIPKPGSRSEPDNEFSPGRELAVVKFLPKGGLDRGFGHEGIATPPIPGESSARVVVGNPDGSLLVAVLHSFPNPESPEYAERRPLLLRLGRDGAVLRRFQRTRGAIYESVYEGGVLASNMSSLLVVGGHAFVATGKGEGASGSLLTYSLRGRIARYLRLSSRGFESIASVAARGRELVVLATRTLGSTKSASGFIVRAFQVR